ncbi:hypothetical protein PHYBOEH_004995 [Phytophthora boehmeriae]|uniref:RxLR effector protein n=1 Tax=Phytophthora boehmeriae TaxID=109152 RepID=A0A8T1WKZ6_9STRA|nr:hypothetical protein PHYBOEH_004995 [Phytophthora boehmeriae]
MRLQYFLLVAVTTFLASAAAVAAGTTTVSTTTSTNRVAPVRLLDDAEANDGNTKRFLRRSNEDQEERANLGGITKWVKGFTTKEGRARRAELKRNHKTLDNMFAEGMLGPSLLELMKDKNMISSKKFTEYMKKLDAQ